MEVDGQHHASAALSLGEGPSVHGLGGWVGPRGDLNGRGKSRLGRDSIPSGGHYIDYAIPAQFIVSF
jgi:hypothetical protein